MLNPRQAAKLIRSIERQNPPALSVKRRAAKRRRV
jgi:hypothetical protein